MLKIESVTMSRRVAGTLRSCASSVATSQCGYTDTAARESRQPSIRLAWLSASLNTASPGPTRLEMTPRLA